MSNGLTARQSSKLSSPKFRKYSLKQINQMAIAVAVVAGCAFGGSYLLRGSHAATPYVSAESESGALSGSASKLSDSTASAGSAIKFGSIVAPPASSATYPRLAGMLIGGQGYNQTSYQQQIAKLDVAILGMYNTWNVGGLTPAQAVDQIKARNPTILLGNYTLMTEVSTNSSDTATADLRAKLSASKGPNGVGDWWGYNAAGQKTNWSGGTYAVNDTNLTLQTTPDSNGDRFPQWMAKRDNTNLISKANWDIWYSDNNFWEPRSDDDWDRNGTNDSASSETIRNLWRSGQAAYYTTAKSLQPSKLLMVNADSDLDGSVFPSEATPYTQYKGLMGGAFMEHAVGKDWSSETWGGWNTLMGWYHQLFKNLASPQLAILDAYMGDKLTDYKTLRYSFGASLMDNGYFSASADYDSVHGTTNSTWLVPVRPSGWARLSMALKRLPGRTGYIGESLPMVWCW